DSEHKISSPVHPDKSNGHPDKSQADELALQFNPTAKI
ncbi:hypothetical protein A2U01_0075808, partial [Trifolium medium]|nr:hypothetical protein [Trifolium medium]